jgi:hypothetical protein
MTTSVFKPAILHMQIIDPTTFFVGTAWVTVDPDADATAIDPDILKIEITGPAGPDPHVCVVVQDHIIDLDITCTITVKPISSVVLVKGNVVAVERQSRLKIDLFR